MKGTNYVFIATSLDGKIADKNNGIDWLNTVPNPDNIDTGFKRFMSKIDALVMGRSTFEVVMGFGIEWPYSVPVFVLSNSLKEVPETCKGKVELVSGDIKTIVEELNNKGFKHLYIDGGQTIQSFLKEDLIDEFIITTIPILLGGGVPLFDELPDERKFQHLKTEVFLEQLVQSHYQRVR
jgi:dihydrofolate reductase